MALAVPSLRGMHGQAPGQTVLREKATKSEKFANRG
jgi:hypothetical protein